jgi:hypothetical protein
MRTRCRPRCRPRRGRNTMLARMTSARRLAQGLPRRCRFQLTQRIRPLAPTPLVRSGRLLRSWDRLALSVRGVHVDLGHDPAVHESVAVRPDRLQRVGVGGAPIDSRPLTLPLIPGGVLSGARSAGEQVVGNVARPAEAREGLKEPRPSHPRRCTRPAASSAAVGNRISPRVRFVEETKNVDIRESRAVLALLTAIPANALAAAALAELLSQPGRERPCGTLVAWAREA